MKLQMQVITSWFSNPGNSMNIFFASGFSVERKKNLSSFLLLISSGFQSDVNWYSQNTALNIQHSAADWFSERGQSEEERQVILIYF